MLAYHQIPKNAINFILCWLLRKRIGNISVNLIVSIDFKKVNAWLWKIKFAVWLHQFRFRMVFVPLKIIHIAKGWRAIILFYLQGFCAKIKAGGSFCAVHRHQRVSVGDLFVACWPPKNIASRFASPRKRQFSEITSQPLGIWSFQQPSASCPLLPQYFAPTLLLEKRKERQEIVLIDYLLLIWKPVLSFGGL